MSGVLSDETKRLMARDSAAYAEKQRTVSKRLGETAAALIDEGYPALLVYQALRGMVNYGLRRADGSFREWQDGERL